MASFRSAGPFDTPPRHPAGTIFPLMKADDKGGSLSGFQSPYSPPTPGPRAPPTPIFTTPQRESNTQAPSSQTTTPAAQTGSTTRAPETPKIGGKWTHPAIQGIEQEARKFMFGEEDLKRLVVNIFLLYSLWWVSQKVDDRYFTHMEVAYA
jgi:hypothetical protein